MNDFNKVRILSQSFIGQVNYARFGGFRGIEDFKVGYFTIDMTNTSSAAGNYSIGSQHK